MFKNALRVATTFGVLLAGYAAYARAFAVLAEALRQGQRGGMTYGVTESKTRRQATNHAVAAFGRGHWAADENLPIRIYNAERGFWMYARDYKRLNDGKQIELKPFALVSLSRDGRALKTATSEVARIDLDQPLGMTTKPGAGGNMKVVHARLEGEVRLRDDKATPDPADDLRIGPLTYLDYDEPTLQITADDRDTVVLEDQAYRVTGQGLLIKLRPREEGAPGGATGFNGAQTAFLKRNVHIVLNDVGPGGMLPGGARPDDLKAPGRRPKTPLDLRCDGLMRIDLPKPSAPVRVGPPAPQGPTVAEFARNVEVLRGRPGEPPDRLNCDLLRLTLVPADKPPAPAPAAADGPPTAQAEDGGSLGALTLRRASATGHNVRLDSAAQRVKARCNELIHEKLLPESPDLTYFRGDQTTKLVVEKVDVAADGPDKGQVTGYTTVRAIDATIYDDGRGNDYAQIVARGPGELETRAGPDKPVERVARWTDELKLQPVQAPGAGADGPAPPARKLITLTGDPSFTDIPAKATLNARQSILVWLKPKAKPAAATPRAGGDRDAAVEPAAAGAGAFEIERLLARVNVRLNAPNKTLVARDWLNAVFEAAPAAPTITAGSPTAPGAAPSAPAPAAAGPEGDKAKGRPAPERPAEPDARAVADRVWAQIRLHPAASPVASAAPTDPAGGTRTEVEKVHLRGAVTVHQDPGPGKARGTDVAGEAVDVLGQGGRGTRFIVFNHDPQAAAGKPRPADADDRAPLAKVDTEDLSVRGRVVGLDQATDQAWVEGVGSLTQMAARGLLSDKGLPAEGAAAKPAKTTPMTITFTRGMKFFGRSTNPRGKPAARAEFRGDVHAETDESTLDCHDVMRVFLDRTLKLARVDAAPAAGKAAEPKAEIALIECVDDVVVINVKLDPVSKTVVQKQRIEGDSLTYNKLNGWFRVPGEGQVFLYEREGQGPNPLTAPALGGGERRVIRPTAGPAPGQRPTASRATAAVGRNGARDPAAPKTRPKPPLVLTWVHFNREMTGRFGTGKESDKTEARRADFFGDVEALRGRVPDADAVLDPDHRPADAHFMTAQVLRVVSEPNPADPDAPPRNLLRAWENAYAATEDKTIQADTITFDSLDNKFYAYGEEGRGVLIAQQGQVGQPASHGEGEVLMYNAKTGQSELKGPRSLSMIDLRTGTRPAPASPPPPIKPMKPKRTPFRNLRGNVERKDFNGR